MFDEHDHDVGYITSVSSKAHKHNLLQKENINKIDSWLEMEEQYVAPRKWARPSRPSGSLNEPTPTFIEAAHWENKWIVDLIIVGSYSSTK